MDNEREETRQCCLSSFMRAIINGGKNIFLLQCVRVICAGSLSAGKESRPSRTMLRMKLKRGCKDTNFFLSMRTAYLLFFCMLVIFGATQQGAHAQAYFPGGPSNWRPSGGYTNPDYSNKGPAPQIIAAGQVVSGAADGASFIGDQMYGVAQIISVIGTWWGYEILPNPTNSLPCNQAFDQSVRENGYWSATVSHFGTSIWNATPYRIGNAISEAAINDFSPEIGGHQFTGQLAHLFGSSLPGAGLIGAVRPIAGIARPIPKPGSGRLPLETLETANGLELAKEPNCGSRAWRIGDNSPPFRYVESLNEAEASIVSLVCAHVKHAFPKISPKPGKPYAANGGFWEVMLGGDKPARSAAFFQQETGACAKGWWLMKYYLQEGKNAPKILEYHFAYHPGRNIILLHYFKQCGLCGLPRN